MSNELRVVFETSLNESIAAVSICERIVCLILVDFDLLVIIVWVLYFSSDYYSITIAIHCTNSSAVVCLFVNFAGIFIFIYLLILIYISFT